MTPTDLETLRGLVKLARKVTQGPWHSYWRTGGDTTDCGVTSERGYAVYRAPRYQNEKQWKADGDFAVAMQAAIPALTALLAERDALRERLTNAIHYISEQRQYYTKSSADYYRKDYMDASYQDEKSEQVNKLLDQLQSILNASLSEGDKHET